MKKIFLGLMACAALCACTSDDLVSGVSTQKTFEGDVAYMTVRLKDVGSGTRATSPSDNDGFGTATADEYAVSDAYFYFYDESGVHVSDAEVWNGGLANETSNKIDFDGETVIILKGLSGKSYPKYVVTVLNRPDGFTPGETLDEMATKLSEAAGLGITKSVTVSGTPTDYFVMSTSSYVASQDTRTYYFTTELTDDDFYEEPIPAELSTITPVDIYVERLAAKIEVGVSSSLQAQELGTPGSGEYGYPLTVTIAGDENADQQTSGTTDVYIKIVGWNLNGTTKRSLMMKDITELSTSGVDGWTQWNDPTFFRSYWGKSYNYGITHEYPNTSGGKEDGTALDDYLDYVSYSDLTLPVESGGTANNFTYCAENTNTATILGSKYSTGITNVIIGAQICDEDGEALELIRYNGELFEEDAYLNYVMSYLSATSSLNVYTKETIGEEDVYTHIDGSYIKVDDTSSSVDGSVSVVVDESAFDAETTYYSLSQGAATAYTNAAAAISAVTTALTSFNTTAGATIYADGMMYYNIPIEHLNNTYPTEGSTPSINEANYGIVRNHWYQLTINSFVDLGVGVYNPDEVIIPNENDDVLYYVGADLHILSWKLVQQGVDLK